MVTGKGFSKADDFARVLDSCYTAAWDSTRWTDALTVIGEYTGALAVTLESYCPALDTLSDFQSTGIDPDSISSYVEYYQQINPRHPVLKETAQGELLYDSRVLSEHEMNNNEFYSDLLRPFGLRYFLSSTLFSTPGQLVLLAEHLSTTKGHATQQDMQDLSQLAPYVAKAYSMSREIGVLTETVSSYQSALEHLGAGVVMLNARGQAVYVNAVAEQLFCANPVMSLCKQQIVLSDSNLHSQFHHALSTVLSPAVKYPADSLVVPGGLEAPILRMDFMPLRGSDHVAEQLKLSDNNRRALLIIRDVASRNKMPEKVLEGCFNLTPKETMLARGLVQGQTLSGYADRSKVKITTVRTHYANLRSKLGARNQSDVMRILLPLMG